MWFSCWYGLREELKCVIIAWSPMAWYFFEVYLKVSWIMMSILNQEIYGKTQSVLMGIYEEMTSFKNLKWKRKDEKLWWTVTFSFGDASPSWPVGWVCAWVSDWAWALLPRVFIITAITFSWTRKILIKSGCWKNVWLFTSFLWIRYKIQTMFPPNLQFEF